MTISNRQPRVRNPPAIRGINRLNRLKCRLISTAPEFGNPVGTTVPPDYLTQAEADGRYTQIP